MCNNIISTNFIALDAHFNNKCLFSDSQGHFESPKLKTNVEELIKPNRTKSKAKHGQGIRAMKSSFLI